MKKFLMLLLFSVLILLPSCGKDEPTTPPDENIVINEKTESIDSTTFKSSIQSIDSASIVISNSSSLASKMSVGSIIVSDYGGGVCRYVTNVQQSGNNIILSTRTARLEEVILKGKIEYKEVITPDKITGIEVSDNTVHYKINDGLQAFLSATGLLAATLV